MRFVTVHVKCDKDDCPVTGEEGDGTVIEKTLSIDGKRGKAFLLCKPHLDEFEEFVLPLMAKGVAVEVPTKGKRSTGSSGGNGSGTSTGAEAQASSSSAGTLVCQVDDCDRHGRPLASRTGMAQHVIRSHGYENLAAYEAEHGTVG
jgi:hypothetical protein